MMNGSDRDPQTGAWEQLKLAVVDTDDLAVISANLQDAECTTGAMAYLPRLKRFALVVDRFDWTRASLGQFWRCRTGLHFERVLKVARRGLALEGSDQPVRLLAISFQAEDAPSGTVLLTFADGGQIRLSVECLEAEMRDMGERWSVAERPSHRLDETPAIG